MNVESVNDKCENLAPDTATHPLEDVEMEDVDIERKMESLRLQYAKVCAELGCVPTLERTASQTEFEEAIQELLNIQEAQVVDNSPFQDTLVESNTPKKKKPKNTEENASFSPSFIREEDEYDANNIVTPPKQVLATNNPHQKIINIIKDVAQTANIPISASELEQMQTWDREALRKKLGEINVLKKQKRENMSSTSSMHDDGNHPVQDKALYDNLNKNNAYDQIGLNAFKVSKTYSETPNVVDKTKPPEVKGVSNNSTNNENQLRHTYSARIRLHNVKL